MRQSEVLAHYGESLIGLNASMNGDLNLRVFETIAGGAMLLTDRLAPGSGLDDLLREGVAKVSYESAEDLVEKARHFLAHPDEARAIGEAGRRWFEENFSLARRQAAFAELVFSGQEQAAFATPSAASTSITFPGGTQLDGVLVAYDVVNELHRQQEHVLVAVDEAQRPTWDAIAATLPRVRVVALDAQQQIAPDLAIVSTKGITTEAAATSARRLWCWDASPSDIATLQLRLAPMGLAPRQASQALFGPSKKSASPADELANEAKKYLDAGDVQGALLRAKNAVTQNPRQSDGYLVLAELAIEAKNEALFQKMVASARRAQPDNPRVALLEWSARAMPWPWISHRYLTIAWKATEMLDFAAAQHYANLALRTDSALAEPHFICAIAVARLAEREPRTDVRDELLQKERAFLEAAVAADARRADFRFALGCAYRRTEDFSLAAEQFAQCVEIENDNADFWFAAGEACLRIGNAERASAYFQGAASRWPDDSRIRDWASALCTSDASACSAALNGDTV
ncbi:MAG: glycosyltransferase [Opitutus sp.]|nr:glycosyltransferase [Opitutus sp.]